ncbi:hypothetical protein [Nissabacter sp. SGAir0207]|uniref:hypothetical protein n=1 Tax=Nissabacter sp. SGAir0207 TaxID=2126321 RepID=UPI0010F8D1C7|nr:hypothetical protein [Nissabacter sp. SGAir0207]
MKTDWGEHRERFAQMRAKQDISIKQYAELYGLNPNTARRYLGAGDSVVAKEKPQASPARSVPRSSQRSKSSPRSNDHANKDDHASDQRSVITASEKTSKIRELSAQIKNGTGGSALSDVPTPAAVLVGEVITAVAGRTKSGRVSDQTKKGGQLLMGTAPAEEDVARAQELLAAAGVDALEAIVIEKSLVNLFKIERISIELLEFLDSQPAPEGDEGGQPPLVKALSVVTAAAGAINDAARTMAGIRQSYAREQREQEKHLRKLQEPERIQQAYQERQAHGRSALDTAIMIESHGDKVPSLLLELARHEIKQSATNDIQAVPIDLMELDKQAREMRAARLAALDEDLAGKREAVNQLVDEGGHGDVAADGSLNDLNLSVGFADDEEPDDDINQLLFGDDEIDGHQH